MATEDGRKLGKSGLRGENTIKELDEIARKLQGLAREAKWRWAIRLNGLRHDSTDKELDEIARKLQGLARDEGVTLENLYSYLIDQRDEAATDHISSSCNSLSDN